MVAEWITRVLVRVTAVRVAHGAGQPGSQSFRKRPDPAHQPLRGDVGSQPRAGSGDLRRYRPPPAVRREGSRADPGPLSAKPAQPGGRPRNQGDLRAPKTPLPRPVGPARTGLDGGAFPSHRAGSPIVSSVDISARRHHSGGGWGDRLAQAQGHGRPTFRRLEAQARSAPARETQRAPTRPHPAARRSKSRLRWPCLLPP